MKFLLFFEMTRLENRLMPSLTVCSHNCNVLNDYNMWVNEINDSTVIKDGKKKLEIPVIGCLPYP